MILFRVLSRFRALFDGDGPSALNRGTTVFEEQKIRAFLQGLKLVYFGKEKQTSSRKRKGTAL